MAQLMEVMPKRYQLHSQEALLVNSLDDTRPAVVVENSAFIGDLKAELRTHVKISSGQLDEAIASGLGFSTYAALLARLSEGLPTTIYADNDVFQKRVVDFGGEIPRETLRRSMVHATRKRNGSVMLGFHGDQTEASGLVNVTLKRLPTADEWAPYEMVGLDWLQFTREFRNHASPPNYEEAVFIMVAGAVEVDGFRIDVGPTNTWLQIVN